MALPVALAAGLWALKASAIAALMTAFIRLATYGVLVALGMSILSVVGFESLETFVMDEFESRVGTLPANIAQIIALTRVDQAMAIILGAWTFSATLGIAGAVTRWRRGAPGSIVA